VLGSFGGGGVGFPYEWESKFMLFRFCEGGVLEAGGWGPN